MKELSTGPWKVAIGEDDAMENWLIGNTGMSRDHDDKRVYITTDCVHASRLVCEPFNDAEFIVACRNYAWKHKDPLERIAELEKALREAKRSHTGCDDPWYSCPMHPDGCADDSREKDECTCGAEDHNAKIDRVLMAR